MASKLFYGLNLSYLPFRQIYHLSCQRRISHSQTLFSSTEAAPRIQGNLGKILKSDKIAQCAAK
jgi:hypothetical protein